MLQIRRDREGERAREFFQSSGWACLASGQAAAERGRRDNMLDETEPKEERPRTEETGQEKRGEGKKEGKEVFTPGATVEGHKKNSERGIPGGR